jgi:hypothetical protein
MCHIRPPGVFPAERKLPAGPLWANTVYFEGEKEIYEQKMLIKKGRWCDRFRAETVRIEKLMLYLLSFFGIVAKGEALVGIASGNEKSSSVCA